MLWRIRQYLRDWLHDLRASRGDYLSTAGLAAVRRRPLEDWRLVTGQDHE